MLRLLKLKPFRKLKVVQRLLERKQARKLRNEAAVDCTVLEDEQKIPERHRSSKPVPGEDGASTSCAIASSHRHNRAGNKAEAKCSWSASSEATAGAESSAKAPADADIAVEAAVSGAAVDASAHNKRPYRVRALASGGGGGALQQWSPPPPPNPYDSDEDREASLRVHRLARSDDAANTHAAAETPTPVTHASRLTLGKSARCDEVRESSSGLPADAAAVARRERADSRDREINRRPSTRAQSGGSSRLDRSNVVDTGASADCELTDAPEFRRPCPTATAATSSSSATATDADYAALESSPQPRSRLRRRHSMPARDRVAGSSSGGGGGSSSTLQRLHRLRRSFAGRLRASKYTELSGGDSQSVLGQEASADDKREPFSKALRRSFREGIRYGLHSLSTTGVASGIGLAMAPSFAMPMPFGGVTTLV